MASPIADLSYRNYDGPLEKPINRWWAIAKTTMSLGFRKKWGFWALTLLAGFPYLFMIVMLYVMDALAQNVPLGQKNPLLERMAWKNPFLVAFSFSQIWLLLLALLIGIGAIANDNRANALLVYLSKPISRLDYLIGKWVGIFIPITLVVGVPILVFYGYCFMSYRDYGFVTENPSLLPRLLVMMLIPGAVHASVALGISSLFNQGRLAGATYAGVYFMALFFTNVMAGISRRSEDASALVNTLYYCSIDGIQFALAKVVLGTNGGSPFPAQGGRNPMDFAVPAPNGFMFLMIFLGLSALSLGIAWSRIRAVEVIG